MTLSISIEPTDNQFVATLIGKPELSFRASTREQAVAALKDEVEQRVQRGEIGRLVLADPPYGVCGGGVSAGAGTWSDDPSLDEMVAEIYAERDRQREEWEADVDRSKE